MRKLFAAAALMLTFASTGAQADYMLYAAQDTLTPGQAQEAVAQLEKTLDAPFAWTTQEETGKTLTQLVMQGCAPQLAAVPVHMARAWAQEGLLLPLDGCVEDFERTTAVLAAACVVDGQLMAAPLFAEHRQMAVNADLLREAMMGFFLDRRAHPVWYPSEFVQALDELSMLGGAGMDVWPVREGGSLYMEALLQGVTGMRLVDTKTGGYAAGEDALYEALCWMEDMVRAGLIGTTANRETALARFLDGETAIFPDWTAEDTQENSDAVNREEIVLLPYPSLSGSPVHAAQLTVLCAFSSGKKETDALLKRAVQVLCAQAQQLFPAREIYDDGAPWLALLPVHTGGATLRALFADAVDRVTAQQTGALEAAQQIDRAMRTLGFQASDAEQ